MTLSFQQAINGKPNYFVHKIWRSILNNHLSDADFIAYCYQPWFKKFGETCPMMDGLVIPPKDHTIRFDPHNRWRQGMDIHPVVKNRTPNRFQFAPVIPCKSVQRIDIKPYNSDTDKHFIYIDGKSIGNSLAHEIAVSDGFDSLESFLKYFQDGITDGSLIHWTDKTY